MEIYGMVIEEVTYEEGVACGEGVVFEEGVAF